MPEATQPQVTVPGEIKISEQAEAFWFPVRWTDWDFVKQRVGECKARVAFWEGLSALALGAGFALLGASASLEWKPSLWQFAIVFLAVGVVALLARGDAAHQQQQHVKTVLEDMEQIEKRFQRPPAVPAIEQPASQSRTSSNAT